MTTIINKKLIDKISYIWYEKNKPKRTIVDAYIGKLVTKDGAKYLITGTKPTTKTCTNDEGDAQYVVKSYALLIGIEWVEWFDFIRTYNRMSV